jgi:hypothetical protein
MASDARDSSILDLIADAIRESQPGAGLDRWRYLTDKRRGVWREKAAHLMYSIDRRGLGIVRKDDGR